MNSSKATFKISTAIVATDWIDSSSSKFHSGMKHGDLGKETQIGLEIFHDESSFASRW